MPFIVFPKKLRVPVSIYKVSPVIKMANANGQFYNMEDSIMGILLLFIGVIGALVVEEYKKYKVRQHTKQQETIRKFLTLDKKD